MKCIYQARTYLPLQGELPSVYLGNSGKNVFSPSFFCVVFIITIFLRFVFFHFVFSLQDGPLLILVLVTTQSPIPSDRMLLHALELELRRIKGALATASFLSSLMCKLPPTLQETPPWTSMDYLVLQITPCPKSMSP